ncbi:EpsG family protein [Clostridium sp. Marseille-Q2269]|uniref:EpsG family protein n=1 Tax=Clostridium sp. Marseille-Q2269 TaxID=2942205 RepID=UPI0033658F47
MIVYFSLLIYTIIIMKLNISNKRLRSIIYFIPLWLVNGLRSGIGTDYSMYEEYFYLINQFNIKDIISSDSFRMENGYNILNKFVSYICNDAQIIFLVSSFFILFLIIKSSKDYFSKYDYNIILFIMLGYYHSSFNGIRQYIAIAIFIYSVRYIFSKNMFKYIILIIIATSFHRTAICLLPIYFITNKIYSKLFLILGVIISLFSNYAYEIILNKILPVINSSYYYTYIDSKYVNEGIGGAGNEILLILLVLLIIISIVFREHLIRLDSKNNFYINILIIGLFLRVLGFQSQLFFRMSLYFLIFTIYLLPYIYEYMFKKYYIISKACIIMFLIFCFCFTLVTRDQVIPYKMNLEFLKHVF